MNQVHIELGNDIVLKSMDKKSLFAFVEKNDSNVFGNSVELFSKLTKQEKMQLGRLGENLNSVYQLNLGLFHKDQQIGWHFGAQRQSHHFYMTNSGILPEFRNRGLYRKMVESISNRLFEDGFLEISSHHHLTNNPVLVAKLKCGFFITGIDMDPRFGMMIVMKKYKHQERNEVLHFRSGLKNCSEILHRLETNLSS